MLSITPLIYSKLNSKIILFTFLLSVGIFTLLYLVGPKNESDPVVRLLHISYSEGRSVVTLLNPKGEKTILINPKDWSLSLEPQPFYQNNLILECSFTSPIYWSYEGYGIPNVKVDNIRKADNFNDTNTYSFQSQLNMMPISEATTGKYLCRGISQDKIAAIYLFVLGHDTLLVKSDLNLDSDISEELAIPCPVSNPGANVTLTSAGGEISEEYIKSFDPTKGFVLNAKYLEERDPIGTYYCEDKASNSKSGKIIITPRKDGTVKPTPDSLNVIFTPKFNGTFRCQAKENVTLKFRKIQKLQKVSFLLNLSSEFPFQAVVQFNKPDLREGSVISCLTVGQGVQLHSWTISMSKSEEIQEPQTPIIFYKEDSDEFVCCGSNSPTKASKALKFLKLVCLHPIECYMRRSCLNSNSNSDKCKLEPLKLLERSGCLHYKVDYNKENISGGLLQCSSDGKYVEAVHFNWKLENGTVLFDYSENALKQSTIKNISKFLKIEKTIIQSYGSERTKMVKYICKGPKYYFARGIVWQIVRYNGLQDFFVGNDYANDGWTISELKFQDPVDLKRQGKKIYCIAPIWNSHTQFAYTFSRINTD